MSEALARDLQRMLAQVAVVMGQVDVTALNEVPTRDDTRDKEVMR